MALDETTLISDLTAFFSDLSPTATAATKAVSLASIIKKFVKTGSIKTGTLSSTGTGNMGLPVDSTNNSGGQIE